MGNNETFSAVLVLYQKVLFFFFYNADYDSLMIVTSFLVALSTLFTLSTVHSSTDCNMHILDRNIVKCV